jgi:hypothetical protein
MAADVAAHIGQPLEREDFGGRVQRVD